MILRRLLSALLRPHEEPDDHADQRQEEDEGAPQKLGQTGCRATPDIDEGPDEKDQMDQTEREFHGDGLHAGGCDGPGKVSVLAHPRQRVAGSGNGHDDPEFDHQQPGWRLNDRIS